MVTAGRISLLHFRIGMFFLIRNNYLAESTQVFTPQRYLPATVTCDFMKNLQIILLLCFCLSAKCQDANTSKKINVLFIGNSLTYYHDMPQMLQEMLNESKMNFSIEQSTFPGFSLANHLTDIVIAKTENEISTRKKEVIELTETEQKLTSKKWDIIILQTGGVSVLIPENRQLKISKTISDIKKLLPLSGCKVILFETWPGVNIYPLEYCYPSKTIDQNLTKEQCCSPVIESLDHEYKLLKQAYDTLAAQHNLIKSANGEKFIKILSDYPEITIYEDDIHPNLNGAFLNACIFYQLLTNQKSSNLKYNGNLDPALAKKLKVLSE